MANAPGIRARNRAAIESEILLLAGEHLARYGAPGLSLRAIARELGMASSAVYRYVASRDELLTRLIIAAYDSLADAVEDELAGHPDAAPLTAFGGIARATRAWALAHPHEYALIYGSPVPDYHAPAERTLPAGTRVPQLLVAVLARFDQQPPGDDLDDRALRHLLDDPVFAGAGLTTGSVRRGLVAWTLVLGAVSSEVFEQLGADTVADPDAFFESVIATATGILTA